MTWLGLIPALAPIYSYSAQYLNAEQARQALFPEAKSFTKLNVTMTEVQKKKIESEFHVHVRERELQISEATREGKSLGYVYIDEVTGKHEFITYAVGVDLTGKVRAVEIMTYRETYGSEVRRPEWRKQFVGKSANDKLKLDEDIANITGATLSSKHITEGVRRLLATHALVIGKSR